jgi:uracil-DNA glycosylase family 4
MVRGCTITVKQADYTLEVAKGSISAHILDELNAHVIACNRCPRLRNYCAAVGAEKRRAYRSEEYWARPVPSFGDPLARVLIIGLAPGAHGSNRTGRPFTGDGSGNFLYPVLYESGFASQPDATSRTDGMTLTDIRINSVVRCAPPGNKPALDELRNCSTYLDAEIAAMSRLRVVITLGKIAFDGYLAHLVRAGVIDSRREYTFAHGAEYKMPNNTYLISSFHPSLQNTNTGKLTKPMFLRIFVRARELAAAHK